MAKKRSDNPFAALDKKKFPKDRRKKHAPPPPAEPKAPVSDEELFVAAMSGVAPMGGEKGRAVAPDAPDKGEIDRRKQEQASLQALQDLVDGKVEFELFHTDEYIEGRISTLDSQTMLQLKAGRLSYEAHLDLHGLNASQAWQSLVHFIRESFMQDKRCVLLIPGRGRNSPEGFGVLREKLQHWLTRDPFKRVVLAFCTALPRHGGAGALYVLLRKRKKSEGKIIWDRTPLDEDLL